VYITESKELPVSTQIQSITNADTLQTIYV